MKKQTFEITFITEDRSEKNIADYISTAIDRYETFDSLFIFNIKTGQCKNINYDDPPVLLTEKMIKQYGNPNIPYTIEQSELNEKEREWYETAELNI